MTKKAMLRPSVQRRRQRYSTIGWEKPDWGGQYATWTETATGTEEGKRRYEERYHGDEINDEIKTKHEGIHEPSWGHDKRDVRTYHARKRKNRKLSAQTRQALEHKAAKAFILAKTLLGSKTDIEVLEDQAAELMDLPSKTLNATLKRVLSVDGDIDEATLQQKIETLLTDVADVADAAGMDVEVTVEEGEEEQEAEETVEEGAEEEGAEEESLEGMGEEESSEEGLNEVMSEDEIENILSASVQASEDPSVDFFNPDSLVDQLFAESGLSVQANDEVSKIDQRLSSTEKKSGVKKISSLTKEESSQPSELESLWNVLPEVSDVFNNRVR